MKIAPPRPRPRPALRVERYQATLDQLRDYVLLHTIYKPAHTRDVVKALVQQRVVDRTPARGQINGATLVQLAAQRSLPV